MWAPTVPDASWIDCAIQRLDGWHKSHIVQKDCGGEWMYSPVLMQGACGGLDAASAISIYVVVDLMPGYVHT
ncbi:hypothetical protein D3C76_716210 [compost metagenome]